MGQKFLNKNIVVTGAAQGIGRAISVAFAGEGANVWALDLSEPKLKALKTEFPNIKAHPVDATNYEDVRMFADALDTLDILVNCVGIVHEGSILETGPDAWARSFDVNVMSMYNMIKNCLPALIKNNGASIINISSVVSDIKAVKNRCAYGATKAAITGLTKSVAVDFLEQGVRCNAIAPGTVSSPSWHDRVNSAEDPAKAKADFIARQPMGRVGTPEEIAKMCLYLTSTDASYITGQTFVIDGGMSL
jgi:NAD(P)-dependent dehydrogenase (short-subunit alcohol dehydrogenase family)